MPTMHWTLSSELMTHPVTETGINSALMEYALYWKWNLI